MSTEIESNTFLIKRNYLVPGQECACSGNRSCSMCELPDQFSAKPNYQPIRLYFCAECGDRAYEVLQPHSNHSCSNILGISRRIDGVFVQPEVIDEQTEQSLIEDADRFPWLVSQSGRRKQDFGPKVNFKRKKVKLGDFVGLPRLSMEVLQSIRSSHASCDRVLQHFDTVELCNLDYCPERGSWIVPHKDDTWIWGDRLVTINLAADTCLVLTPDQPQPTNQVETSSDVEIVVQMPRRSLFVLSREARYHWLHEIRREHIHDRRLAITFRELSPEFMAGGDQFDPIGRDLLRVAQNRI
jgi:alkylated DNA repair protein alkB family protein 4